MRIGDERESDNVEDMRGVGGGGGFPIGGRGLGIGGILIALAASYFLGVDPGFVLNLLSGGSTQQAPVSSGPAPKPPQSDQRAVFVSRVLASTEDTWSGIFSEAGRRYVPPKLVLFTGSFPTACGMGQAAMGPFYCPGDQRVYLDLSFFDEMAQRFHAPGQFPQAYVIAHEIGHHVQNLLGISAKTEQRKERMSRRDANAQSVQVELQADCFAGVWANRADAARGGRMIDDRDVEQALAAASAIGDDRLQRQSQGRVVPDSFTHGSSAQRMRWFRVGLESGDPRKCDTFSATNLG